MTVFWRCFARMFVRFTDDEMLDDRRGMLINAVAGVVQLTLEDGIDMLFSIERDHETYIAWGNILGMGASQNCC